MRDRREASIESRAADSMDTGEAEHARRRRISSSTLFDGEREVVILHQGQEYRLRITRADKLILTK